MKMCEIVSTDPHQAQADNLKKQEKALKVRKARIKSQQAQSDLRAAQTAATKPL
jgi:hypothetical protein